MTQEFVKRVTLASISLILIGGLFGCSHFAESVGVNVSQISDVKAKSAINTTVTLRGKVQNRAPFLGMGAYQLKLLQPLKPSFLEKFSIEGDTPVRA